jgi:G3E family GTPase
MVTDPQFLEPEYPFEWGGVFTLDAGEYTLVMQEGPDPAIKLALLPAPGGLASAVDNAVWCFSEREAVEIKGTIKPAKKLLEASLPGGEVRISVHIALKGDYALFTEHHPDEFNAVLCGQSGILSAKESLAYKPDHEHDDAVSSVGITISGDLDHIKLNKWLGELLQTQGQDIFRMKGVLAIKGDANRFVFQGVHMLFDGQPDRPWGKTVRTNKLIFIGRNLNRVALTEGFRSCLA